MRKIILILVTIGLVLPIFSFAQISVEPIKERAPGILAGWWNSIKTFFGKAKDVFLGALKKAWNATVMIWKKMWKWLKGIWDNYIWPKIKWLIDWIWEKILNVVWKWILEKIK